MSLAQNMLNVTLEFSGGAELLFGNVRKHDVTLKHSTPKWNIGRLLMWIKDNLLQQRPELFIQGNTVRPGILVLINEADWMLLGETEYEIENHDTITFISTLHGG